MKPSNKIKLANLTTWIMIITISVIALFFISFVVSSTFNLTVFTERTSTFLASFLGLSAVLIICSAILNISLNIGLIADSKIKEMKVDEKSFLSRKFYFTISALVISLIAFLFFGDYITRKLEKDKIINEANDLTKRYNTSIDAIFAGFSDTSKLKAIPQTLTFLANQKNEFRSIEVIVSKNYNGQLTYLQITTSDNEQDLTKPFFGNSFYKCDIQDCNYLAQFFSDKTDKSYFWTDKNDYKFYSPFIRKDKRFILLFTKYNYNRGSIGS